MTLISFLLGGGKLYAAIDRTCARIFQVERQPYAKQKLFAVLMMPLIPVLLLIATLVSVTASAALALPIEQLTDVDPTREETLLGHLLSYLMAFGMLLLAY